MVVTDDGDLADRMRLFANKGWPRQGGRRDYLFLGLNYRMSDLTVEVAPAQLARLRAVVARRRASPAVTTAGLSTVPGLRLPPAPEQHSYWYYPILLQDATAGENRRWAEALTAEGVPAFGGYLETAALRGQRVAPGPHLWSLRLPAT